MPTRRCCLKVGTLFALGTSPAWAQVFPEKGQRHAAPGSAVAFGCGLDKAPVAGSQHRVLRNSGDGELDEFLRIEVPALKRHFRVSPILKFHADEGSGDVWAIRAEPDAIVSIGNTLIHQEKRLMGNAWNSSVAGILAHEWAHAFQYSHTLTEPVYMWETHADFLAGWYLGARSAAGEAWIDADAFATSLGMKRNGSGFFNPNTHGSSRQRIAAVHAGVKLGKASFHPKLAPYPEEAAELGYAYVKSTVPAKQS